jgi:sugar (pentulose or hexulose) kinase
MNVANAVDCVRDFFGWELHALEQNVGRSQPGANGLTFPPYFSERLRNFPDSCAVIHGLDSTNVNRHDIARALIERNRYWTCSWNAATCRPRHLRR